MSTPVVTVAAGGLPVVDVGTGKLGLPVTEATNGRGIAVTKVVGKPGLPVVFDTIGVTAPFTGTTWNAADKSVNITLSNADLTASATSAGGSYSTVRTISSKASGKYYFEMKISGSMSANMSVGIANALASVTSYLGANNNSIGMNADGVIFRNNASVGTGTNPLTGDIVSCAVDRTNNMIWFRVNGGIWNNNAANDPATNIGGVAIALVTGAIFIAWTGYIAGDICILNTGSSAFAYPVLPAGFAGWPP